MFIKSILAYLYIFGSFLSLGITYVLKCNLNINTLNTILYVDYETYTRKQIIIYYLSHFILFFIYGILFGIKNIVIIIIKILIYEILLIFIKYCDIKDISIFKDPLNNKKLHNLIFSVLNSIILSIISYYIGTQLSDMFYNSIFNLNNKFYLDIDFINKNKK